MSVETVPVKKPAVVDPVTRSLAKPDACAKFASLGKPSGGKKEGVRVRPMAWKDSRRKRKKDPRAIKFY